MEEEVEICTRCAGNGYTNPPHWTVVCDKCGGSGVDNDEREKEKEWKEYMTDWEIDYRRDR